MSTWDGAAEAAPAREGPTRSKGKGDEQKARRGEAQSRAPEGVEFLDAFLDRDGVDPTEPGHSTEDEERRAGWTAGARGR